MHVLQTNKQTLPCPPVFLFNDNLHDSLIVLCACDELDFSEDAALHSTLDLLPDVSFLHLLRDSVRKRFPPCTSDCFTGFIYPRVSNIRVVRALDLHHWWVLVLVIKQSVVLKRNVFGMSQHWIHWKLSWLLIAVVLRS
jgi:hypothetical protein